MAAAYSSGTRTLGAQIARFGEILLLVIDVGNTNTVIGLYEGEVLAHHFRISTRRGATSDEYGTLMVQLLERVHVKASTLEGCVLASVVPPINRALQEAISTYFNLSALVVGPGMKTGMRILTDVPAEVGADRVVNAVAAWQRHQAGCIVVDFGTATTFDAVNEAGEYMGGAIAPGIDISMDALFNMAAKLPRVELRDPGSVVGKNTVTALQSGLFFGYVGLVDGIVSRMKDELGFETKVIATGGLAHLFAEVTRTIEEVDDHLTLDGLRTLWSINKG